MRTPLDTQISSHGWRRLWTATAISIAAAGAAIVMVLVVSGVSAISAQDKYTGRVPTGLAFSEFRGFEDWPTVAVSQAGDLIDVIVANPVMIKAYRAGAPGNGKAFPDGSKMAKIHWNSKKRQLISGCSDRDGQGHPCRRVAVERGDAREAGQADENPRHYNGLRTQRHEWTTHAGNPSGRPARGVRAAQGRGQCVGQRRLRQDGARHRQRRRSSWLASGPACA